MSAYDPLYDPARPLPPVESLDLELAATDRILDETAGLNIHSDDDMLRAAVALNIRLRLLAEAVRAERGEQP